MVWWFEFSLVIWQTPGFGWRKPRVRFFAEYTHRRRSVSFPARLTYIDPTIGFLTEDMEWSAFLWLLFIVHLAMNPAEAADMASNHYHSLTRCHLFLNNGCAGRIHNTHAGERSCVLDLHIGFLCMVLDKEVDMWRVIYAPQRTKKLLIG